MKTKRLLIAILGFSAVVLGQQKDIDRTPPLKSDLHFACNTGYKIQDCREQIKVLRSVLAAYPTEKLGTWTWVLVKSDDWQSIVQRMGRNTDSPAFSVLEKRETFLEEALFANSGTRRVQLLRVWSVPLDKFLDFAVTHELGHSICDELDEAKADAFGRVLRDRKIPECSTKPTLAGIH